MEHLQRSADEWRQLGFFGRRLLLLGRCNTSSISVSFYAAIAATGTIPPSFPLQHLAHRSVIVRGRCTSCSVFAWQVQHLQHLHRGKTARSVWWGNYLNSCIQRSLFYHRAKRLVPLLLADTVSRTCMTPNSQRVRVLYDICGTTRQVSVFKPWQAY